MLSRQFVLQSVLLLLFYSNSYQAYRILIVYPAPSYSHQQVQQAVSEGLAKKGHELVIITPNPMEKLRSNPNVTQIDASFIYEAFKMGNFVKTTTPREFMQMLQEIYPPTMDMVLSMPAVQALIKNEAKQKFDAVICENLGFTPPFFMFAEIYDAALIGLGSLEMPTNAYAALGNIRHPILHTANFVPVPSNPNFFQRLQAVYQSLIMYYWEEYDYTPSFDWIVKKHFNVEQSSVELMKRMDFAIEGVSPLAGYARPLLPNIVQIGFLHVKPPKPLPNDLEEFINSSKHGVIYCSFGTNVKPDLVDLDIIEIMVKVFSGLKYDVLWKFKGNSINNSYKNIKIVEWVPQQDVLAHSDIKLFITQGGAQSRDEAVARGIPLLVIPFFGDQIDTGIKVEEIGVGKLLFPQEISVKSFQNSIESIIQNKSYEQRSKEIARMVNDAPMKPVESAVYWIEYVIRNRNGPHMKYKAKDMPLYQYLMLDIVAFYLIIFLLIALITYRIVKKCQQPIGKNSFLSKTKQS